MHSFLKQSTASQSRAIGPFVDDTDFKTAETGLTIANTDIKLVINGAASANKNSGGGTHRVNGMYGITFDATDTATVGEINLSVVVSGALPVFATFVVVEEAVYDMLFGASALGYIANAPVQLADGVAHGGTLGSSTATLALSRLSVVSQSANTNAITATGNGTGHGAALTSGAGATGNGLTLLAASTNGHGLKSTGTGTGDGAELTAGASGADLDADIAGTITTATNVTTVNGLAANVVTAAAVANGAIDLATYAADALPLFGISATGTLSGTHSATTADLGGSAPGATSDLVGKTLVIPAKFFARVITAYNTGTGVATFESTALTLANGDVWYLFETSPSSGGGGDATEAKQDTIIALIGTPSADLAADIATRASQTSVNTIDDFLDTEVAAIKAKTDNLPSDPADASDIAASFTTVNGKLDTIDDFLDTEIAAIKAKTDSLTFTTAGMVDSAVKRVGNTTLNAAGTGGQGYGA